MATGNQPQQNQNNRPLGFDGIEGLLSAVGVGALAIGGYIAYTNELNNFDPVSLQAMREIAYDPRFLTSLGIGVASAFTLGVYRLGRRHGRN